MVSRSFKKRPKPNTEPWTSEITHGLRLLQINKRYRQGYSSKHKTKQTEIKTGSVLIPDEARQLTHWEIHTV